MNEIMSYLDEVENLGGGVVLLGFPRVMTVEEARECLKEYDSEEFENAIIANDNIDFEFYGNKGRIELL